MFYRPDGVGYFNTMPELLYDMFIEMGLSVRRDQYLYDQDTGNILLDGEKYIKASIDGNPVYPGRNDVVFDPTVNYNLTVRLFCYYLDKVQQSEDGDLLQGYIAHYTDDSPDREKQRVVVKTQGRGEICSNYYWNLYLGYLDCVFTIAGYKVDLSNFDVKPVDNKKSRK